MGGLEGPAKPDTVIDPVRAAFDRIAEQYAADFADELTRKPWDVERLRRFAAACPPGPVLDVGCGAAGHVGRFLAELDTRADRPVIGVDFSERSAALARRLNPALSYGACCATAVDCSRPSTPARAGSASRNTRVPRSTSSSTIAGRRCSRPR